MRNIKLVLLGLVAFAFVSPSHGMTAAEIITRVRLNIRDQATVTGANQQFSDAQLLSYLNDGQREANILAWLLQGQYTITLVSGTREYALPSDFVATDRVIHNNVKLTQTSLNQLDADSAGWLAATGATPQKYYLYRSTSVLMGFVPKPTSPTVTAVTVYYLKQPIELSVTSETPWNGWYSLTPYHTALVYYVTYRAYKVLEEPDEATAYYNEWIATIDLMRKGVYMSPDFNPGFIGQRK